jgi:hypothetical protein
VWVRLAPKVCSVVDEARAPRLATRLRSLPVAEQRPETAVAYRYATHSSLAVCAPLEGKPSRASAVWVERSRHVVSSHLAVFTREADSQEDSLAFRRLTPRFRV